MKTAKEHFDRKYEVRRNFYNESAIPLDQRGFIFECMESYAKEQAVEFFRWMDEEKIYGSKVQTTDKWYDEFINQK